MKISNPTAFWIALAAIIFSAIGVLPTEYGIICHFIGASLIGALYYMIVQAKK